MWNALQEKVEEGRNEPFTLEELKEKLDHRQVARTVYGRNSSRAVPVEISTASSVQWKWWTHWALVLISYQHSFNKSTDQGLLFHSYSQKSIHSSARFSWKIFEVLSRVVLLKQAYLENQCEIFAEIWFLNFDLDEQIIGDN